MCAESESEIKSRVAVDRLQEKKTRRQTRRRRQTKKSRAAERERDKAMLFFFLSLSLKASPRSPHTVRTAGGMCIESNDHDSQTHTHTWR